MHSSPNLPTEKRSWPGQIASKLLPSFTVRICILIRLNGIQLPDPTLPSGILSKDATETGQRPKEWGGGSPAGLALLAGHLTPGKGRSGSSNRVCSWCCGFDQVQAGSQVLLSTSTSEPLSSCMLDGDWHGSHHRAVLKSCAPASHETSSMYCVLFLHAFILCPQPHKVK